MQHRGITLDPFQEQAIRLLHEGHSVLVSAPTGTGKTIIADAVVQQALDQGRQVIYTAPVKALSNQKFRDYCRMHGPQNVGLVTGDIVVRREAPCLVMTTEILRNMLLDDQEQGAPEHLAAVILDEIHFLDDRERGTVWEEVLIYLPSRVRVLGLSATLSNLREFADWLSEVRGERVHVVEERERAVPLEILLANRELGVVSPAQFDKAYRRWKKEHGPRNPERAGGRRGGRGEREGGPRRASPEDTRHGDIFRMLVPDLAPYLYFVFSRRLAEEFARSLSQRQRTCLVPPAQRPELHDRIDRALDELGSGVIDPDLERMYRKGIAFHHAGLHVSLKALVEELYERKLLMVLYTTSTFALGVNMPARAVVLDGYLKYDGRATVPLTVREFLQQAGRAGRRGLDERGCALLKMDFEDYAQAAPHLERYLKGEPERVNSSFNLSFNSVVSLLERHDREVVRQIVERSFLAWRMRDQVRSSGGQVERLRAELSERGFDPEAMEEAPPWARKKRKELRRMEHQLQEAGERAWQDFERRRAFLVKVRYIDEDDTLLAGGRILRNIRIEEIFTTELVLSGVVDELSPSQLFGVLCAMSNSLPKNVQVRGAADAEGRLVARRITELRRSPVVVGAEQITGQEVTWDPELIPFGEAWAEGHTLEDLMRRVWSNTDISGQLVSGFRRAKDLLGQLRDVFYEDPHTFAMLGDLISQVSRDEVEVID